MSVLHGAGLFPREQVALAGDIWGVEGRDTAPRPATHGTVPQESHPDPRAHHGDGEDHRGIAVRPLWRLPANVVTLGAQAREQLPRTQRFGLIREHTGGEHPSATSPHGQVRAWTPPSFSPWASAVPLLATHLQGHTHGDTPCRPADCLPSGRCPRKGAWPLRNELQLVLPHQAREFSKCHHCRQC